jgi:hypothetical protein
VPARKKDWVAVLLLGMCLCNRPTGLLCVQEEHRREQPRQKERCAKKLFLGISTSRMHVSYMSGG